MAAAVVSSAGEVLGTAGDIDHVFELASVTKLLTAYTAMLAVQEGVTELDDAAGPPGATVRHLLAHSSGYDMDSTKILAAPGQRRIYSNTGFDVLAEALTERSGIPFAQYLQEALLAPLQMTATELVGSPAAGARSTVRDLIRFAAELQQPTLLEPSLLQAATTVAFPTLDGVLPGFGRQRPNDWGLGFELKSSKSPHWTAPTGSPKTFGHFGQTGTFLWVDPEAKIATVALTNRNFGSWAAELWPPFSAAVLAEVADRSQ